MVDGRRQPCREFGLPGERAAEIARGEAVESARDFVGLGF
jgi:hypothetical protein